MKPGEPKFAEYEAEGLKEAGKLGLVLIAGGLGERLGYGSIKIDLPVCTIKPDYCYLKYYTNYVHALREKALPSIPESERDAFYVPFCIMVSGDTHDRTIALLEKNDWFGLGKDRVDIVKQENVPALLDNSARIAFDKEKFKVITKPHGHGDIHNLLYDSGVAKKWLDLGKDWMIFIQDTNSLALKAIPSALGVSRVNNFEYNSVCCPRVPGEALGAICRLVDEKDPSKELVINVEYNQLDSLLKEKWNPLGDIKSDNGYSHFPGNTNTLVFKLDKYCENLTKTGGVIPEFVNPKYANAEKTIFKAPTRLECMMQDYPKLLSSTTAVGYTMYETWYINNPAKTNIKDAKVAIAKGIPSYGAMEAEYHFYEWTNRMLEYAGVEIERNTEKAEFEEFCYGPKILLDAKFALTLDELKEKFEGHPKISKDDTIILDEKDSDTNKVVKVEFKAVESGDPEVYQIRGYKPDYV